MIAERGCGSQRCAGRCGRGAPPRCPRAARCRCWASRHTSAARWSSPAEAERANAGERSWTERYRGRTLASHDACAAAGSDSAARARAATPCPRARVAPQRSAAACARQAVARRGKCATRLESDLLARWVAQLEHRRDLLAQLDCGVACVGGVRQRPAGARAVGAEGGERGLITLGGVRRGLLRATGAARGRKHHAGASRQPRARGRRAPTAQRAQLCRASGRIAALPCAAGGARTAELEVVGGLQLQARHRGARTSRGGAPWV